MSVNPRGLLVVVVVFALALAFRLVRQRLARRRPDRRGRPRR